MVQEHICEEILGVHGTRSHELNFECRLSWTLGCFIWERSLNEYIYPFEKESDEVARRNVAEDASTNTFDFCRTLTVLSEVSIHLNPDSIILLVLRRRLQSTSLSEI